MTTTERLPEFPAGGCAVVIGGSGGIGRAIAVQLAGRGCDVALAAEEGRFGVRANAVGVGVITDGLCHALVESRDFDQRFLDASRQVMALKRLGTAEEVAEGVVFLASSRARWISGQTLMVDGGYAL